MLLQSWCVLGWVRWHPIICPVVADRNHLPRSGLIGTSPQRPHTFWTFEQEDGRWLLDDVIEFTQFTDEGEQGTPAA